MRLRGERPLNDKDDIEATSDFEWESRVRKKET
jgi:hypothetical protein